MKKAQLKSRWGVYQFVEAKRFVTYLQKLWKNFGSLDFGHFLLQNSAMATNILGKIPRGRCALVNLITSGIGNCGSVSNLLKLSATLFTSIAGTRNTSDPSKRFHLHNNENFSMTVSKTSIVFCSSATSLQRCSTSSRSKTPSFSSFSQQALHSGSHSKKG